MRARAWLLVLILGVPIGGYALSAGTRSVLDDQFRAALREQNRAADPARFATTTLASWCQNATGDGQDACETDSHLALLGAGAIATAVAGLALLGLIAAAGRGARSNRNRLLTFFRPGLRLTAVAITGLIAAHALIAIAAIYYAGSVGGRLPIGIVPAIGLGGVAGISAVARTAFSIEHRAQVFTLGRAVTPAQAPQLWQRTEDIANRLGALRPQHIVIGLDPTFFVTEADITTPHGTMTGRTLFCSLPLARILTTEEFTAIIGHELGHFRGEDTRFSEQFYPIYRGTVTAIVALQSAAGRGFHAVTLLPAIAVFGFFLERFALAERHHSRSRELLADRAGVEAASARTMASALVKVHAFGQVWDEVLQEILKSLTQGTLQTNASALFAEKVANRAIPTSLDGIMVTHTSHPTDSHPPLADRLDALDISLSSVTAEALSVNPAESAAALVASVTSHEEALGEAYQRAIALQVGINLAPSARTTAAGPSNPMRTCAACRTRVLRTPDGHCPACGVLLPA